MCVCACRSTIPTSRRPRCDVSSTAGSARPRKWPEYVQHCVIIMSQIKPYLLNSGSHEAGLVTLKLRSRKTWDMQIWDKSRHKILHPQLRLKIWMHYQVGLCLIIETVQYEIRKRIDYSRGIFAIPFWFQWQLCFVHIIITDDSIRRFNDRQCCEHVHLTLYHSHSCAVHTWSTL